MNKKYLLAVAASTLMFAACGDEVTEIHQDGMAVLEKGEKLSKQACDTTNVGEMLFVMDSSEAFICDGESWQTLKGEKGKNVDSGAAGAGCSAKPVKNKAGRKGVEVSCGGAVVDTIWNGENGKPGDPGDAGTSCSAKSVKNKAGLKGLEVTCGGAVVDTIWNGAKGESGNDGVGCSAKDEGDGSVTLTCGEGKTTLYKAVCGTVAYDPAKSFCSEGGLYSCDDKPYDPAKSFCSEGTLYSCGDKPYDPAKSFCSEGEVYELCGGKTYEPKKQYCLKVTRGGTDIYSVEALLTDARDEEHVQVYKTVEICNNETSTCQTWMAENLNYSVNPDEQSWCGGGEAGKKNEGDCSVYGRLYTWAAAVGKSEDECGYGHECDLSDVENEKGEVRGVCPEGWHLPSYDEWDALFTAVGGTSYAGQKLKADSDQWNDGTSNDDSFGFAVLPAGYRGYNGGFDGEGDDALFWSSTENDSDNAYGCNFRYDGDDVYYDWYSKDNVFSVRCLRD